MKYPEKYRMRSTLDASLNCFEIPFESVRLRVIASIHESLNGKVEHVSVSLPNRCPNWREMCFIKDLFFDAEEECIQFHPKKSNYVNLHNWCLHLWKLPIDIGDQLTGFI